MTKKPVMLNSRREENCSISASLFKKHGCVPAKAKKSASLTNNPKEDILKKGNARFSFGRLHKLQ